MNTTNKLVRGWDLVPGMVMVMNDPELQPEVVKTIKEIEPCEMDTICVKFTDGSEAYYERRILTVIK